MSTLSLYKSDYHLMSIDRYLVEQADDKEEKDRPLPGCSSSSCTCCTGSCRRKRRKREI